MKATMDANGVITLKAETSVESYALKRWSERALIMQDDLSRAEQCHWRGSMLIVSTDSAEAAP